MFRDIETSEESDLRLWSHNEGQMFPKKEKKQNKAIVATDNEWCTWRMEYM